MDLEKYIEQADELLPAKPSHDDGIFDYIETYVALLLAILDALKQIDSKLDAMDMRPSIDGNKVLDAMEQARKRHLEKRGEL